MAIRETHGRSVNNTNPQASVKISFKNQTKSFCACNRNRRIHTPTQRKREHDLGGLYHKAYVTKLYYFFCWLSHLKMSFYYLTSYKEGREVVYFLYVTL